MTEVVLKANGKTSEKPYFQFPPKKPTLLNTVKQMVAKSQEPVISTSQIVQMLLTIILPIATSLIIIYTTSSNHTLEINYLKELNASREKDLKLLNQNFQDYIRETEKRLAALEAKNK